MTKRKKGKKAGSTRSASRGTRALEQGRKAVKVPAAFETVREIALSLENVEEGASYGTPAFKVGGELFTRLHQDGESLVVRMDFEQRAALMEADPETYYITDHYLNYQWILVRLSRVHPDALQDLLRGAWRAAASSKRHSSRRPA
ncbi:MAG: MmcQ/YjbR family DNA-binding protein [Candidatus Acidiferrales bacterium]